MRIHTNTPALQSYNALTITNNALSQAISRLSTGLRINTAADDAAGLAVSEKMRSQHRGLDQATRNSQDGISMIQTAEGALGESHSILQRMRELAVQAANDTLTADDRQFVQLEIEQLKEELNRISTTTQFNKKMLLDGSSDAHASASADGVWLNVNGDLSSIEGNYKVAVQAVEPAKGQVLKSNILTYNDGVGTVAGASATLASLKNFTDENGVSLFDTPQSLTISLEGGGEVTIQLYATDTVADLTAKLSQAIETASGVVTNGAEAQFVGYEAKVPGPHQNIATALSSHWLEASARRIEELYGLTGLGKELVLGFVNGAISFGGGSYAESSNMTIDMALERYLEGAASDPELGATILHELVHATSLAYEGLFKAQTHYAGLWLTEGISQYIEGANNRVASVVNNGGTGAGMGEIKDLINRLVMNPARDFNIYMDESTGEPDNGVYAAAYLVTRYFDTQSVANGGTGIKGLLEELIATGVDITGSENSADAAIIDAAINTASNGLFNDRASLVAALTADDAFIQSVANEDYSVDTGAMGGGYQTGNPANNLSVGDLLGEPRGVLQLNPLSEYGWSGVDWSSVADMESIFNDETVFSISQPKSGTLQSVEGTILLHSNIAGLAGRIAISGDEKILQGLGFAQVQEAKEPEYSITITDAHSGSTLVSGYRTSGQAVVGVLHENADFYLYANCALSVDGSGTHSGAYGAYLFQAGGSAEFFIHIASNATMLQVGANEGETFGINFGDVSARALGVDKIRLTDRTSAIRAIASVDEAIGRVSAKRARLGAYQNRLEHTINNLTIASTNIKASESRIRDVDFAKEMLNFTKLNILSQAGNSMLAQANQLPQNVLALMR